jgi:hypothetical protein
MTNDINELLNKKDFSELTPGEKSFVLELMTENEYVSMREALVSAVSVFESENRELIPDASIRKNLAARIQSKDEEVSKWNYLAEILLFRVPAYQAAAILIIGLIMIHYLSPAGKPVVLYSTRTDTVFVEKTNDSESIVKNEKPRATVKISQKKDIRYKESGTAPAMYNPYAASLANLVVRSESDRRGRTIQSDSSIYRNLVTAQ